MTLRQQQTLFAETLANLIYWIKGEGYEVTLGETYRPEWVQQEYFRMGRTRVQFGLHQLRLAADLNLFINGVYQVTTEAHEPIGVHWETMHELCIWGGHFQDGNHYSMTFMGLK